MVIDIMKRYAPHLQDPFLESSFGVPLSQVIVLTGVCPHARIERIRFIKGQATL